MLHFRVSLIYYVHFIYSCFINVVFYAPLGGSIFQIYGALSIKMVNIIYLHSEHKKVGTKLNPHADDATAYGTTNTSICPPTHRRLHPCLAS